MPTFVQYIFSTVIVGSRQKKKPSISQHGTSHPLTWPPPSVYHHTITASTATPPSFYYTIFSLSEKRIAVVAGGSRDLAPHAVSGYVLFHVFPSQPCPVSPFRPVPRACVQASGIISLYGVYDQPSLLPSRLLQDLHHLPQR